MFHSIFSNKKEKVQELFVTIDNREKNSLVASYLKSLGFKIEFKQLPIADYIINDIAIERKTITDLKSSIINKRIISQIKDLKQYKKNFLIIEGLDKNQYNGGMHENALRGFLFSLIQDHKVPIIFTLNPEDTAKYIYVMSKKKVVKTHGIRPTKSSMTEKEQLQFILEGFPGIGPASAKKILEKYKTIKQIANTELIDLKKLIGEKATGLHEFFNLEY